VNTVHETMLLDQLIRNRPPRWPRPPRRAGPRRLAAILFLCVFAAQTGQIALTPVLAEMARSFDVSTAAAGQIRTVAAVVAAAAALAAGLAVRRVGLRTMLGAGLLLLAGGSVVAATAPSAAVLALGQAVVGASWGVLVAAGVAAAAAWTAPEHRGRTVAWSLVGAPVAWVVGLPAAGLAGSVSWRAALSLPLLAAGAAALALRSAPRSESSATPPSLRAAAREPGVTAWSAGELLGYAGWSSALVYVGAQLAETYGASPAVVGLVLGLGAAAYVPGTFAARRVPENRVAPSLALLGVALAASILAWGVPTAGLAATGAAFALLCFLGGARTYLGSARGLAVAPSYHVETMALRAAAAQLGVVVGVATAGLALAAGGYASLAVALATLSVASAVPHASALSAARSTAATPRPPRPAGGAPARAR
jgi:predicted MFS family arabinose efflux permease